MQTAKYCKAIKEIISFNANEKNYENDIKDNTNSDQANNKYLL